MSIPFQKFFEPKSVAVVGASAVPHKPGNDVIRNILANEYSGKLYLVNPKGEEILGMKAYSSIQELPGGIDLAVIILPASLNPQAIRDCAAGESTPLSWLPGVLPKWTKRGRSYRKN